MSNEFSYTPTGVTTHELAKSLKMQAQSIRKRLSLTGSYFGVRPVKLPNGRLRWPCNAAMLLQPEKAD